MPNDCWLRWPARCPYRKCHPVGEGRRIECCRPMWDACRLLWSLLIGLFRSRICDRHCISASNIDSPIDTVASFCIKKAIKRTSRVTFGSAENRQFCRHSSHLARDRGKVRRRFTQSGRHSGNRSSKRSCLPSRKRSARWKRRSGLACRNRSARQPSPCSLFPALR